MTNTTPRIYCACLASYNNGHLHGKWINANQNAESIMKEIKEMLKSSPVPDAEEWAIHDFEGFANYRVCKHADICQLSIIAAIGIAEHQAAYAAYANWMAESSSEEPTPEHFEECFKGRWESERDFALKSDVVEELYGYNQLSSFWQNHIDWDSVAEELFMDSYHSVKANEFYHIYVFETEH